MNDHNEGDLARMSIGEHLRELRLRLIWSLVALGVTCGLTLSFQKQLLYAMSWPHRVTMEELTAQKRAEQVELTKQLIGASPQDAVKIKAKIDRLEALITDYQRGLITGGYTEAFMAYLKLALIFGIFAASPIIAWQIWAFVAAGLYKGERKWVHRIAPFSLLLFIVGCLFGFFILIRYGLLYLAGYGDTDVMTPLFRLSDYLELVMTLTIVAGCLFELPLIMLFLSLIGLVPPSFWNKWRRHMIVAIVVLAAFLTPPDPVSLTLMALPLWFLYEFGFLLSWLCAREKKKA